MTVKQGMKTKYDIIKEAEIKSVNPRQKGGQNVGLVSTRIYLKHEETGFYIEVEAYRSQYKNRELAITLFELYLSEAFKL